MRLAGKTILLIVTGGIAAYKSLELIRLIQNAGGQVQAILTPAATKFVAPLSVATLSGRPALTELFDQTREAEIGHIELSRSADLIVVAPASADFLGKMAHGLADDLASTTVLATDTDILATPSMNVRMWQAKSTQRNLALLATDGVRFVGPDNGNMACGEFGPGRMAEPATILDAIVSYFGANENQPLAGRHVIVTSGPTREWLDPVRFLSNASSGKQGSAIGAVLAELGARVSFISGPAEAPPPAGCTITKVETALEMAKAVRDALPADIAVFCAAVSDWRAADASPEKLKKVQGEAPVFSLTQNPDILAGIAGMPEDTRPRLVIGFAAETGDLAARAQQKFAAKGCDWLLANDVSPESGVFGGDQTSILFVTASGIEDWGRLSKVALARKLAAKIADTLPHRP